MLHLDLVMKPFNKQLKMKNEQFAKMVSMEEISKEQLETIDGGFIIILLEAAAVYAAICAVSYGAGALYGLAKQVI